jgi:integrase
MSEKRVVVWIQQFRDRATLQLQWHDPATGKRRSRTAGTADPKEAEQARKDLEYELTHGKFAEASRLTWSRFRELFEAEHVDNQRLNTRESYWATFDGFEQICHPGRLRSISERTISLYAAGLRKKGNEPSTVKTRLQLLRAALLWAVRQKMLAGCPNFPSIKVKKKRPQPIPSESFEKLYDKAPDAHMRTFLLCGWLAGLRLCEALSLEREATDTAPYVDLAQDRIVLPAEFAKACEDQWVPLDLLLRESLLALPDTGPRFFRFVAKDQHEICESAVGHRVIVLAAQAGVKLTMHSLRKGFGCRYAGKVPAQVLQRLLRHSDIKLTMDYYANVDDAVREAVLGRKKPAIRDGSRDKSPYADRAEDGQDDVKPCPERAEPRASLEDGLLER